ncbi:MAG TPA: hypothetical protein VJP07_00335, partial [Dehalococcoidia bacterium]|nr:hypothetical protein [Dehalococcoidia bacterium]
AVVTRTVAPTETVEPEPDFCWTIHRKIAVLKQVLRRLGSEEGERRYKARYDLDHDGDIDWRDVEIIFVDIPTCPRRHGHGHWDW